LSRNTVFGQQQWNLNSCTPPGSGPLRAPDFRADELAAAGEVLRAADQMQAIGGASARSW